MAYRDLMVVAEGTKKQLDACITALDLHGEAEPEIEQLIEQLNTAASLCDTIITKGEAEPEPAEGEA